MIDCVQQGILRLVHSAITGEAMPLPEGFDLTQAMPVIKAHQIGNLVYYGAANGGIDTKIPVMQELFAVTYKCMITDERQRKELKRLMEAFDANGIHYMPVKGVLMKALYPKTDMRIMGDADILIKFDQYDRIQPLMEQLGYTFKVETDHELVWDHPSLHLELHRRLMPDYNVDFARYYGDCWRLGKVSADNSCRYEMTEEDHMIFLFLHFAKHYRNGGIGIRHMLDLYVYKKAKSGMDEDYIARELQKMQMYDFYCNIMKTLLVWFENAEADQKTELITQRIFLSGAYGSNAGRNVFEAVRDRAANGMSAKQIQRKSWLHAIFLPYPNMCISYPVLKKAPVLLPAMWVVRWVQILLERPQVIIKHRNKVRNLNAEKLDTWESQMNAVGLAFEFKE